MNPAAIPGLRGRTSASPCSGHRTLRALSPRLRGVTPSIGGPTSRSVSRDCVCGDWLFVGWKARLLASGRVDHVAAEQCDLAGFLLRVRPRRPRSRAPRNELPPSHPVIFLAVGDGLPRSAEPNEPPGPSVPGTSLRMIQGPAHRAAALRCREVSGQGEDAAPLPARRGPDINVRR